MDGSQTQKVPYGNGGMDTMYTPDGQAYGVPSIPNYGPNPWGQMLGGDTQAQMQGTQQANQNIGALQGQMGNYGGDASAYPAMQNSYGLGNMGQQPSAIPGSASNPSYQTQPINITMPDSGSRGFNPWSLQGESNARGK